MRRLLVTLCAGIMLLAASTAVPVGAAIGVLHVDIDATGANNGATWDDAFTSLADALALAAAGDEIWVAEGVYNPHPSDRTVSFPLVSGTKIIGGFDGTEALSSDADPGANPTILSGDLSGNDSGAVAFDNATRADNSLRIFDGSDLTQTVDLIGLTISDGNADAESGESTGGPALGLVSSDVPLTLRNVSVRDNSSRGGLRSGAVYVSFAPLTIIDSVFDNNVTNERGGALYCVRCDLAVTGSIFSNNKAHDQSGSAGAMNLFRTSGTIMNTQFIGNSAAFGGALDIASSSGAVNILIANVLAVRNQAVRGLGSFMQATSGDFAPGTTIDIVSSTIIEPADVLGITKGALYIVGTTPETTIANSIIWDDAERAIPPQSSEDQISVANSILSGSGGSANWNTTNGTDLGGNLDVEPQFRDAGAGDYTPTGPAAEAGDNARLPADVLDLDNDGNTTEPIPLDFLGANRTVGVTDMGAIENQTDLGGPVFTFPNPVFSQDSPMQLGGTITDPTGVDRLDWVAADIGDAGATGTDPTTINVWDGARWVEAPEVGAPFQADITGENWTIDWDPLPGGSGSYAIGLQAYDTNGNKSPADRRYQAILVITDFTPPQIASATVQELGGQLIYSGVASEDVAIRKVRLIVRHVDSNSYWNGQTWIPAAQTASTPSILLTADLSEPLSPDPEFQYSFTPNRTGKFESLIWAHNGAYRYSVPEAVTITTEPN